MTVDSCVEISNGILITPPAISSFTDVVIEISKVTRGSLFIAVNNADIFDAVQNGAYGIIFDKPTQIIDSEIAWIKVDSIQNSVLRFLKYFVHQSENEFYLTNSFQYEILRKITISKDILLLKSSNLSNFNIVTRAPKGTIFVSKDKQLLEVIAPAYIDIKKIIETDFDVIRSTMFETSFRYHKRYYEFLKVPQIFLDDFLKLLSLLDRKGILYTLDELNYTKHFFPVFVNKNLKAKEFGESDRVLIFEPNESFVMRSVKYLEENLKWANCIYIFPKEFQSKYSHINKSFFFDNKYQVIEFLKGINFNFAYLGSSDYTAYEDELTQVQQTQGLFYV